MNGILSIEKEVDNVKFWERNSFNDSLGLSLWNHEVDKNVTIYVDGKEITVHSCVLSARSPFFAKMFEFGITEGKVEFVDFAFDIVEKAIRLCYDQNLVNYTTFEENIQLLHFFDKYDIQALKDDLEIYLVSQIDASTVCRLANASLISNALKLKRKSTEFLQDCMKESKPVSDLDLLDKDVALKLFKVAFYPISE